MMKVLLNKLIVNLEKKRDVTEMEFLIKIYFIRYLANHAKCWISQKNAQVTN